MKLQICLLEKKMRDPSVPCVAEGLAFVFLQSVRFETHPLTASWQQAEARAGGLSTWRV